MKFGNTSAAGFLALILCYSSVSQAEDVPQMVGSVDTGIGTASEYVVGDVHPQAKPACMLLV